MAPRIVNIVSYVTWINHENYFAWQAHYLVMLEDERGPGLNSQNSPLSPWLRSAACSTLQKN